MFKTCLLLPLVVATIIDISSSSDSLTKLTRERDELRKAANQLRFEEQTATLDGKYRMLIEKADERTLIHLKNDIHFNRFLVQQPRNYSAFALFNRKSYPNDRCSNCEDAHNVMWRIAQDYYKYGLFSKAPLLFFEISSDSLAKRLELTTFPLIMYFPMEGSLHNITIADSNEIVVRHHHRMVEFMEKTSGFQIQYHRVASHSWSFVKLLIEVAVVWIVYKKRNYFLKQINSYRENSHFYLLILAILLVSGHTFNYVTLPAPIGSDQNRNFVYILRSRRHQYQVEAYILSFIYFLFSFGMILLIEGRRKIESVGASYNRMVVIAGLVMTISAHFWWMSVTQIKMS